MQDVLLLLSLIRFCSNVPKLGYHITNAEHSTRGFCIFFTDFPECFGKLLAKCFINCITHIDANVKKWRLKYWSIVSYASFYLKFKCVQCISAMKELALHFKYFWRVLYLCWISILASHNRLVRSCTMCLASEAIHGLNSSLLQRIQLN